MRPPTWGWVVDTGYKPQNEVAVSKSILLDKQVPRPPSDDEDDSDSERSGSERFVPSHSPLSPRPPPNVPNVSKCFQCSLSVLSSQRALR